MPEFVLNRTYVLAGKGHMIRFEKGTPTWVPPELARAAVGIGAEPVGEKVEVLDPEKVEEPELTGEDREALIFAAFDELVARNEPTTFDGAGKPMVDAVKALVANVSLTKKERDQMWHKYRESKAAE